MVKHRIGRVEQEIQKEVNDIILKRVRDPRVQDVTITGVQMTGDLQNATIFFSILSDKASEAQKAQEGLDNATGLIRRELSQRLTMFKTPELKFKQDDSIRYGERIDELIRQMHEKENK
ncbi:30S ribosome-binding factor RbfA [Lactobacillus sp. YT155]|uniref:30S ribosome-binding factor RbfA n=1 Tax=Lactobacillus sp. YT155 TaxID=3060955 RepID=UPI00265E1CD3|nr:30S ribosome-binding factor RbfA [Lactobacillus sp. YT155]MDO1605507.1 30S ribosome-binding factor RbfA [Lactobacillus sp. YT155]